MSIPKSLCTERLTLRQWKTSDYKPFAQLNANPKVMEYFPGILTEEESNVAIDNLYNLIEKNGWDFWAVELNETSEFIGFVGLHTPKETLPFSPCIEIGWRLDEKHWGNGYATEAAIKSLEFAFEELDLEEVVSFTTTENLKSQNVMKKIGMTNTSQNFMHPAVPKDNPLCEHVLYKITKEEWVQNHSQT